VGSSAPWRFELIISPCVPVQMVPLRRAWSCTSKATPFVGSSVTGIIAMSITSHHQYYLNICIKSLIHQLTAQRRYTSLQYKFGENIKASYWASIHRKRKVLEKTSSKPCKWVMWSRDVQACGCSEDQGCKSVTCGCLCRRRVVPVMDAFFPSLFLPLFFYSFILFCFFVQELIRGHCLGMVTKVGNVTHKHFYRDEKVGS
jgi:hypothetical protein